MRVGQPPAECFDVQAALSVRIQVVGFGAAGCFKLPGFVGGPAHSTLNWNPAVMSPTSN